VTKVSFIGLAGTGFSLDRFTAQFLENQVQGVTPFIINADGAIEIHRNKALIAYNAKNSGSDVESIYSMLDDSKSKKRVKEALAQAQSEEGKVTTVSVQQDGHKQLMSFVYFPLLDWFVVTNIDLANVSIFDASLVLPAVSVFVLLLVLLLVVFWLCGGAFIDSADSSVTTVGKKNCQRFPMMYH